MLGLAAQSTKIFSLAQSQFIVKDPHVGRQAGENNPHEDAIDAEVFDDEPISNNGREQRITEQKRCDSCGRMFKGERGVNIHFGKVHKTSAHQDEQIRRSQVSARRKTRGNQGQEEHHSAPKPNEAASPKGANARNDVHTNNETPSSCSSRKRLRWPPASDKQWSQLDEDLEAILNTSLRGKASDKLQQMTNIIFSVSESRFESKQSEKQAKGVAGPSRRQRAIASLRKDLRSLRQQWKRADETERDGLRCLRDEARKKLASLRRAEKRRRKSAEERKAHTNFFKREIIQ